MATKELLILTAVDVRRATQPDTSRAVTIEKLTIPAIKFVTAGHNPGGGVMEVNFTQPRIEPLEPAFSVKGVDRESFKGMGLVDRWIFAGAYRDKKTGKSIPGRAVIEGALTEWEPDESDPNEFQGCTHALHEVTHFQFSIDDEELWYIDFWERIIRRNGIDLFADDRRALGA